MCGFFYVALYVFLCKFSLFVYICLLLNVLCDFVPVDVFSTTYSKACNLRVLVPVGAAIYRLILKLYFSLVRDRSYALLYVLGMVAVAAIYCL